MACSRSSAAAQRLQPFERAEVAVHRGDLWPSASSACVITRPMPPAAPVSSTARLGLAMTFLPAAIAESLLARRCDCRVCSPRITERPRHVASLQIYGIARTRAFRALWVAKELGIDYEHLPIEIGDAGARTPEFLAINPNGRLPVIVDGDFVLFELLAITMYLAKKHSPGKLYPASLEGEARTWQWSLWAVTEVDRGVNIWSLHAVRLPEAERDAGKREEALKVLAAPFRVLDAAVSKQPYLLGNDFTVADLNVAAVISRAVDMDLERIAEPESLARSLPRPARRARGAGAEVAGRQRDAGRGHAPDRPDQPAVSMAMPGQPPVHLGQTIGQAVALHQQGRLDEAEKL